MSTIFMTISWKEHCMIKTNCFDNKDVYTFQMPKGFTLASLCFIFKTGKWTELHFIRLIKKVAFLTLFSGHLIVHMFGIQEVFLSIAWPFLCLGSKSNVYSWISFRKWNKFHNFVLQDRYLFSLLLLLWSFFCLIQKWLRDRWRHFCSKNWQLYVSNYL